MVFVRCRKKSGQGRPAFFLFRFTHIIVCSLHSQNLKPGIGSLYCWAGYALPDPPNLPGVGFTVLSARSHIDPFCDTGSDTSDRKMGDVQRAPDCFFEPVDFSAGLDPGILGRSRGFFLPIKYLLSLPFFQGGGRTWGAPAPARIFFSVLFVAVLERCCSGV